MRLPIALGMTFVVLGLLLICVPAGAVNIDVTSGGGWSLPIDDSNLQAGAGSDLTSEYESDDPALTVAVTNTLAGHAWEVDVRRSSLNWHANFTLWVRRTSTNAGVTGGTSYVAVGTVGGTPFFACVGGGDVTGIDIQEKVTGVSVATPQCLYTDTYSATITYTVLEAP